MLCLRKWGAQGAGKKVLIYCDNQATVQVVNSGAAKNKFVQACLREIHHICAFNNTEVRAVWVKTSQNTIADILSRWDQSDRNPARFAVLTEHVVVEETKIERGNLEFIHTTL